jgi:transposase
VWIVAGLFGVSLSTIKRHVKRCREGGDLKPKRSMGRKRRNLATTEEKRSLWTQLEENEEATLERHCELSELCSCGEYSAYLWTK